MIFYAITCGLDLVMLGGVALVLLGHGAVRPARWIGLLAMTVNTAFSMAVGAVDSAAFYFTSLVVWLRADPRMQAFLDGDESDGRYRHGRKNEDTDVQTERSTCRSACDAGGPVPGDGT